MSKSHTKTIVVDMARKRARHEEASAYEARITNALSQPTRPNVFPPTNQVYTPLVATVPGGDRIIQLTFYKSFVSGTVPLEMNCRINDLNVLDTRDVKQSHKALIFFKGLATDIKENSDIILGYKINVPCRNKACVPTDDQPPTYGYGYMDIRFHAGAGSSKSIGVNTADTQNLGPMYSDAFVQTEWPVQRFKFTVESVAGGTPYTFSASNNTAILMLTVVLL